MPASWPRPPSSSTSAASRQAAPGKAGEAEPQPVVQVPKAVLQGCGHPICRDHRTTESFHLEKISKVDAKRQPNITTAEPCPQLPLPRTAMLGKHQAPHQIALLLLPRAPQPLITNLSSQHLAMTGAQGAQAALPVPATACSSAESGFHRGRTRGCRAPFWLSNGRLQSLGRTAPTAPGSRLLPGARRSARGLSSMATGELP